MPGVDRENAVTPAKGLGAAFRDHGPRGPAGAEFRIEII